MSSPELVSRRVPWRAALLGVAATGLGQLYSGRPLRAIVVHLLAASGGLLCITAIFIPSRPWNIIAPIAGLLLMWLLALGDAARCAKKAATDYQLKPYNRWYVYLLLIALVASAGGRQTLFSRSVRRPEECHRFNASHSDARRLCLRQQAGLR